MNDTQLLADGCTALLQLVFGEHNWYRWNNIKQQTQFEGLQGFITWVLDVAEEELNKPTKSGPGGYSYESVADVNDDYADSALDSDISQAQKGKSSWHASITNTDTSFGGGANVINLEEDNLDVKLEETINHYQRPISEKFREVAPSTSVFSQVNEGDSSVQISYQPKSSSFFCNICSVNLSDIEVVQEHKNLRHASSDIALSCYCCHQMFSTIEAFVDFHWKNAASNHTSKGLVCTYCAKNFKNKQLLEDHIANKHHKLGPRHECPGCSKKFSHACNLNKHKKGCALLQLTQQS